MTTTDKERRMNNYFVRSVSRQDYTPYIMEIHYAKRMPSISFAFGLFENEVLVGVVTYGQPASPWLCKGICGEAERRNVLELNRLVLKNNKKNEASFLVCRSLKLLPKPKIIVSYADTAQSHAGIIYQASNFLFTGTTKARTDMAAEDGKHSRHHAGDRSKRVDRSPKHRYVTFIGSKGERARMLKLLNYPVQAAPKTARLEQSFMYDLTKDSVTQEGVFA